MWYELCLTYAYAILVTMHKLMHPVNHSLTMYYIGVIAVVAYFAIFRSIINYIYEARDMTNVTRDSCLTSEWLAV